MFFVAFDESSNTQGYVGYSPLLDRVVVAFRGTVGSSVKNIYEDLMAWKSQSTFGRCGDCEVHSGFLKDHNALHPQIVHGVTLALQAHPGVPIIVTGHSLGAGALVAASCDLCFRCVCVGVPSSLLFTLHSYLVPFSHGNVVRGGPCGRQLRG